VYFIPYFSKGVTTDNPYKNQHYCVVLVHREASFPNIKFQLFFRGWLSSNNICTAHETFNLGFSEDGVILYHSKGISFGFTPTKKNFAAQKEWVSRPTLGRELVSISPDRCSTFSFRAATA
jgi:hypothetical protein